MTNEFINRGVEQLIKCLKKQAIGPLDTDELEILVYNDKRERISLGRLRYSIIKNFASYLSNIPGISEVQAIPFGSDVGYSWSHGQKEPSFG